MKNHFNECQGWVEEPLSPSEDSLVNFLESPPTSPLATNELLNEQVTFSSRRYSPKEPLTIAQQIRVLEEFQGATITSSWNALEGEELRQENITRKNLTMMDHIVRLGCSRKDMLSIKLRRKRFQGEHLTKFIHISENLSSRIDSSLNAPREDDQGLDYDNEDQDGNLIPVPKRTAAGEKKLKRELDLELDQLLKGDYCKEPSNSSKD